MYTLAGVVALKLTEPLESCMAARDNGLNLDHLRKSFPNEAVTMNGYL